ncbi:major facilitator superfamily domain-containing protein [Infundibulicybe gibba]|nr:major facilitator superfamily domain-containing protein [Infundibulicybe gibba]
MSQDIGTTLDHRRSLCDSFLMDAPSDSESDHEPADTSGLLGVPHEEPEPSIPRSYNGAQRRAFFVRSLALLCACSLSVGSHYASYILGPLKSRLARELGTTHTEFSLLISAYSLNSTWTPLLGGVLASTLGTTLTSILATGVILLGQILLLVGDIWGNVRLMTLGLFVFGFGISPLAVVQETIIVRFFKSHGLGVSMAFGLIAGKGASFISARTSYPLTEKYGPRAPFYVATSLAALSVVVNLIYIAASKWLVDGAGAELEAADIAEEARRRSIVSLSEAQALEKVAEKRRVNLRQITKLGDVFWAYIGLNVLCGAIWSPFLHLAANIIETRYGMPERDAANEASYLLAGSLILYPICGLLVDRYKERPIVVQLLTASSILTFISYLWLALPPAWTTSPAPAITAFAAGHGFAPLLLVVLVPKIVPLKYVSTALGAHKSLEQTGSTIFQTFSGLVLDIKKKDGKARSAALQHLLNIFLALNILQFISIIALTKFQKRKNLLLATARRSTSVPSSERTRESTTDQTTPLLEGYESRSRSPHNIRRNSRPRRGPLRDDFATKEEQQRGEFFAVFSAGLIIIAWVFFIGTAWMKLGMKKGGD